MQIQNGSVSVTNGQARVIGDADVDWSDLPDPTLKPVVFTIVGSIITYQVGTVTAPADSGSGFWELTVVGIIQDPTDSDLDYAIHINFSKKGFPLFSVGDVQTQALLNRFALTLDANATDTTDENNIHDSLVVTTQAGETEFFVMFTAGPLPFTPLHISAPIFQKSDPSEDNIEVVSTDSWGLSGFNVNLSGPAVAGQTLRFSYIKAPASNGNLVVGTILITGGLIGQDIIPVPISPALATPPAHVDKPIFEKVNPGDDNIVCQSVDDITDSGYNVYLNAPAEAGQIMHYSYQKV